MRRRVTFPPTCVVDRVSEKPAPAPAFPLCCLGLESEEVSCLFGGPGGTDWWDAEFEIGRAPFGARYCAVSRAVFESFAPAERALAPAYRSLIRARGSLLRGEYAPNPSDAQSMAFERVSPSRKLGVSQTELGRVLRNYVDDIPASAASIFAQRDELVGTSGRLGALGAIAGVAFAMVARAPHGSRLKLFQSFHWWKASRMLRALTPSSKTERSPLTGRVGLDNLAHEAAFERLHALIPAQPGGKSRVWGANSFAALPVFGGEFDEEVARQRGYRTPASSRKEKGAHSGLWLAVVGPYATAAVPGGASVGKVVDADLGASGASRNADILGKVYAECLGDCSRSPSDSRDSVANAKG